MSHYTGSLWEQLLYCLNVSMSHVITGSYVFIFHCQNYHNIFSVTAMIVGHTCKPQCPGEIFQLVSVIFYPRNASDIIQFQAEPSLTLTVRKLRQLNVIIRPCHTCLLFKYNPHQTPLGSGETFYRWKPQQTSTVQAVTLMLHRCWLLSLTDKF